MDGEGLPENTIWCFQAFLYPEARKDKERPAYHATVAGSVTSSAQAMDHSLPAKAESSLPPLCLLSPQNPKDFVGPQSAKGHRKEDITMLEDLICPTWPVRLPALPASRPGRKPLHLFARPYAGGGSTDAGSSFCPLPKGARPPRECSSHPLSSGAAVILLNSFYNRDGLILYCFPEN